MPSLRALLHAAALSASLAPAGAQSPACVPADCMNRHLGLTREQAEAPIQQELDLYRDFAGLRSQEAWTWSAEGPAGADTTADRFEMERRNDGATLRHSFSTGAKPAFALRWIRDFRLSGSRVAESREFADGESFAAGAPSVRHAFAYAAPGQAAGERPVRRVSEYFRDGSFEYGLRTIYGYAADGLADQEETSLVDVDSNAKAQARVVRARTEAGLEVTESRWDEAKGAWEPELRREIVLDAGGRVLRRTVYHHLAQGFVPSERQDFRYDAQGRLSAALRYPAQNGKVDTTLAVFREKYAYLAGGEVEEIHETEGATPEKPYRNLYRFDCACRLESVKRHNPEYPTYLWNWYEAEREYLPASLAPHARRTGPRPATPAEGADALGRRLPAGPRAAPSPRYGVPRPAAP